MQSVDESYEYVSLDADTNGMAGGDRNQQPAPEPPTNEGAETGGGIFAEYPPKSVRELGEENGIHYFEDGHFYTEVRINSTATATEGAETGGGIFAEYPPKSVRAVTLRMDTSTQSFELIYRICYLE